MFCYVIRQILATVRKVAFVSIWAELFFHECSTQPGLVQARDGMLGWSVLLGFMDEVALKVWF